MGISKPFFVASEADWDGWARDLCPGLSGGQTIWLEGPLGAGKTSCARALIRALLGQPALVVPSPTFTLVQLYEAPHFPVWHWDLYRIKMADEMYEAGWEQAVADGALQLIEWPERAAGLLPPPDIRVVVSVPANGQGRMVTVTEGEG